MLSADLAGGILTVVGTKAADLIELDAAGSDFSVSLNGEVQLFNAADVQLLHISGGGGNDTITIADDVLIDAWVSGGKGHDSMDGGGGNDVLNGDQGHDVADGDAGDDEIHGGNGHDSLHGGTGSDDLDGENGHDDLFGDEGNDDLDGGTGNDEMLGGLDDDVLHGDKGNDHLDGEDGDDLLDGDEGEDVEEDGLSLDLDVELSAVGQNESGASAEVGFEMEPENDGMEVEFEVEVEDATPNSVLDVLIDGYLAGQITTDGSGDGELHLSSDPDDGNESAFPSDFPAVTAGAVVSIGGELQLTLSEGIEFSLYNWNVQVGDTIDLSMIIESGSLNGVTLSGDAQFTAAFQAAQSVTITPEMLQGGDHGLGRYRIFALDASGDVLDHFTIRIQAPQGTE